jgi:hypothetical protein
MAATEQQIRDLLVQLDPTASNHWTNDGLPLIAALGIEGLTRKEVTNAAPYFTRTNMSFEAPQAKEEPDAVTAKEKPTKEDPVQDLQLLREGVNKRFEEATEKVNAAKRELQVIQDELDELDTQLSHTAGRTNKTLLTLFVAKMSNA